MGEWILGIEKLLPENRKKITIFSLEVGENMPGMDSQEDLIKSKTEPEMRLPSIWWVPGQRKSGRCPINLN
jgi:hypothetical protein